MTKRFLLAATILFSAFFYFAPQPEAKAIDPVTMAILAPLAIQAAKILAPYVIRALGHMAKVLVRAGKHLFRIIYLPIGLVQCTILAPWQFKNGAVNIFRGFTAPFLFVFNILILPLAAFGIGV